MKWWVHWSDSMVVVGLRRSLHNNTSLLRCILIKLQWFPVNSPCLVPAVADGAILDLALHYNLWIDGGHYWWSLTWRDLASRYIFMNQFPFHHMIIRANGRDYHWRIKYYALGSPEFPCQTLRRYKLMNWFFLKWIEVLFYFVLLHLFEIGYEAWDRFSFVLRLWLLLLLLLLIDIIILLWLMLWCLHIVIIQSLIQTRDTSAYLFPRHEIGKVSVNGVIIHGTEEEWRFNISTDSSWQFRNHRSQFNIVFIALR